MQYTGIQRFVNIARSKENVCQKTETFKRYLW